MNLREQKFIAAMTRCGNQTQAAIEAGYSPKSARHQGMRLATKAYIREAIEKAKADILASSQITREAKRKRLWEAANSDPKLTAANIAELNRMDGDHAAEKHEVAVFPLTDAQLVEDAKVALAVLEAEAAKQ